MDSLPKINKSWGWYQVIYSDPWHWTKALTINAGESLSLHYHQFRVERWYPLDEGLKGIINGSMAIDLTVGSMYLVPQNVLHRIINPTDKPKRIVNVAHGTVSEADLIHIYNKDWS